MRVVVGGIWHETNTYAVGATELDAFEHRGWHKGEDMLRAMAPTRTEVGGMLAGSAEVGIKVLPAAFASATPSGIVTDDAWNALADDLLQRIAPAGRFDGDGVLLSLHGAMVTASLDDPEGVLLEAVRAAVGPDVPIVVTIDLHANVSQAMARFADVIIGYDTCPHVDPFDRGREAAHVMARILRGEIRPTLALAKPGIIVPPRGAWTERSPMATLFERVYALETDPRVVAISITAGFPPADVSCAGMAVLVTTDGDAALAQRLADELSEEAWRLRSDFVFPNLALDDAVALALDAGAFPIVMVDLGDSVGAGSTGDGAMIFAELIRRGARGAVVALADPAVVAQAVQAGVGARLDVRVGGKLDPRLGLPVEMQARVRLISDGEFAYSGPYMTGQRTSMGTTAVLEDDAGNKAVVSEHKTLPFDHEQLRSVGISPENCRIIIVKTAISWRAAYGHLAKQVLYVDTPGPACDDLRTFYFTRVPRPIYPLDQERG
jgi:microcystin degradation protein MlrC